MIGEVTGSLIRRLSKVLRNSNANRRQNRTTGERLVFVGGAPRSGTTLVQHILDSHTQVFGGPEFDCIPAIVATWRQVVASLDHGRITVFCSRSQIDAAFANLIENLLLPVADAHSAHLLSEKTPMNALVFCDLLELMPNCRAIHVVRDPRAVVASLLNVGNRARAKNSSVPSSLADVHKAIELTLSAVHAGCHAQHVFPKRVLTIRYEDLVLESRHSIQQLCEFLGLEFESAMLQPQARKHPAQDSIVALDNGIWLDPKLGIRSIEASRLEAWRSDLDAGQIDAVNVALREHPGYRHLGYQFN